LPAARQKKARQFAYIEYEQPVSLSIDKSMLKQLVTNTVIY
jgi:hypothetical protein